MKNILLTGSGGFIGSHLKKILSEKYNLLTPRSKELNLLDKTAVQKYFEENSIDFIVHSASYGVRITPDATLDEVAKPNIEMFNNLADMNIPMITIGSGAEYDKSEPLVKVKESDFDKRIPKDPYGYSKYMISKEIEKRENILNLRLFGIYGTGEDKSRVTSCIVDAKLKNEPVILNQNVKFDFIWIDDFCRIVEYFVGHFPKEKFINVTPTESIEIVDLAKLLEVKVELKKEGMNKEYTADNTLLMELIPNFEFTSYGKGIELLWKKYKENSCII